MATKNIVPRADGEGSLGTSAKKWGAIYADSIVLDDEETLAQKISAQNTRITTAEGNVTTLSGTVETLSGDVTTLYGNVDELSDGKADKSTTYTKTETDTELAKKLDLSGGTMIGPIYYPATHEIGLGKYLDGADLVLIGKNSSSNIKGHFFLRASDGTNTKQLQGTPSGELFWAGNNVETVAESGTNYIRYASGVQICWGRQTNGDGSVTITYPKAFISKPYFVAMVVATGDSVSWEDYAVVADNVTATQARILGRKHSIGGLTTDGFGSDYIAIGRWK